MYRLLLFFVLLTPVSFTQTTWDYSDVAVIINDNASDSEAIGLYFKQARNIPAVNMIHISAPVTEIIDSAEFEIIRTQIEDYLLANNLVDSINYIVTTKGVPVRVERTFCSYLPPNAPMNCGTVESELSLMFSSNASAIGVPGFVANPFYNQSGPFSREAYGIYLVTRLDGYTYEDVVALIDNSGPNTPVNPNSTQHIFDLINMPSAPDSSYFAAKCENSTEWLQQNGWMNTFHPQSTQLDDQYLVADLVRYDFYDENNPQISYSFTPGSFAEIMNTAWNFSFDPGTTQMKNHLPSFIGSGLTSGHTYAYSTYFSLLFDHRNFVKRYYVGTSNLAEAQYSAIPSLSSVDLVLGDPKASIMPNGSVGISETPSIDFQFGPNPASELLTLIPGKEPIQSYTLYDGAGRQVYFHSEEFFSPTSVNVSQFATGSYILEITSGQTQYRERLIIQH